jgi:hypothetical protein
MPTHPRGRIRPPEAVTGNVGTADLIQIREMLGLILDVPG